MKIDETYIRHLTITGIPDLDPIRVTLQDIGPGQGRINIECFGQAWANYWGGMGNETIAEFFASCSAQYISGKLSSVHSHVFNPEGLADSLKREIIKDRRNWITSKGDARKRWNAIADIEPIPETVEGLWYIGDKMHELLGDEWWYSLPEKPNPDYVYLCRIIKAVQAALKELADKAITNNESEATQ